MRGEVRIESPSDWEATGAAYRVSRGGGAGGEGLWVSGCGGGGDFEFLFLGHEEGVSEEGEDLGFGEGAPRDEKLARRSGRRRIRRRVGDARPLGSLVSLGIDRRRSLEHASFTVRRVAAKKRTPRLDCCNRILLLNESFAH